jgi:hypothetical protein
MSRSIRASAIFARTGSPSWTWAGEARPPRPVLRPSPTPCTPSSPRTVGARATPMRNYALSPRQRRSPAAQVQVRLQRFACQEVTPAAGSALHSVSCGAAWLRFSAGFLSSRARRGPSRSPSPTGLSGKLISSGSETTRRPPPFLPTTRAPCRCPTRGPTFPRSACTLPMPKWSGSPASVRPATAPSSPGELPRPGRFTPF